MSTITQFLFRRGTDAARQTTLLASGEPGITTDSNRLFVGDGVTPGGNIAGNINFGIFNNIIGGPNPLYINNVSTGIDSTAYVTLTGAQIGDLFYELSTGIVYSLSATPNGNPTPSQLYVYNRNIALSSSEFFFGPNSQLNLATQGISGFHISPAATDNTTLTINNNLQLGAQLGSTTTGIANTNLQYAPANSVKGNFSGIVNQVTDQVFLTGNNVYQFLGTASNTNLGVVGLSAGRNVSFTTTNATESNGQTLNTLVIDSTPNIEAGDGISYNYNPNTGRNAISTYNSLQYLRPYDLEYNYAASQVYITPGDGTVVPTINMPYNTSTASISSIPVISFETVAPVSQPPSVTLYWIALSSASLSSSGGTVFGTNSAVSPPPLTAVPLSSNPIGTLSGTWRSLSGVGPLYPSYWINQQWTTNYNNPIAKGQWGDGYGILTNNNSKIIPTYAPNNVSINYPASVNCMYLSGTSTLWLGGNFTNLGPTTAINTSISPGVVRYGIACINLLSGGTGPGNIGSIGTVITLSAPVATQGLNIINSNVNGGNNPVGLTMLTPGYSVNQITPFNNLLCVGGCWGATGTATDQTKQPSTSLAIFDTTNNYNLTAYTFVAYNPNNSYNTDTPATITSLVSAGSFLYVAGNFYKCKLASDTTYAVPQHAGLTRIKLQNCKTGTPIDTAPIGTIDTTFSRYIANQLYYKNFTPRDVWAYPIVCINLVPNLSGGFILYAGGNHWVQYGGLYGNNYRYQYLTTHWIGNTALGSIDGPVGTNGSIIGGQDGTLTSFNSVFNGPVNTIVYNYNTTDYVVYVGGKFTNFTSRRIYNQTQVYPCNNLIALDTTGYVGYPYTSNSYQYSISGTTPNIGNTPYTPGSIYTSPDAPHVVPGWGPAFDDEVMGIDFHEVNSTPSYGQPVSALYVAGKFNGVGGIKSPYAVAVGIPAQGQISSPVLSQPISSVAWSPAINGAPVIRGGRGCHITRIPYTNPLSGVLIAGGNAGLNHFSGFVRGGWGRVSGIGESPLTYSVPALSTTVTWCAASTVLGANNFINVNSTFVASLSDPIINGNTINSAYFGPKSFPSLAHIRRGDLCRFAIYRPGAFTTAFNTNGQGIPADTYANNIQILGVKLDWDTGSAISQYSIGGYSTLYAPASSTATLS